MTSIRHGLDDNDAMRQHNESAGMNIQQIALDAASSGILITDANQPDHPIIYANKAFERLTGYTASEILGRNCRFLQNGDRDQPDLDRLREAIKTGDRCTVVLRNYRKDGTLFWNELKISPVHDDAGTLTHFIGVQDDITDRIETQQRLEDREAQFRMLFVANPIPMLIYDPDTLAFLDINDAAIHKYGYTREEFLAMRVTDLRPEADRQTFLQEMEQTRSAYKHTHEWRHRRRDGSIIYVDVVSHTIDYDGAGAVLAALHDVTDRVEMAQVVRESERRYRAVSELSFDYAFSIWLNPDGTTHTEWATDAFENVTGFTPEESTARGGWMALIHPDDLPEALVRFRALIDTGHAEPMTYRIITKNGDLRYLYGDYHTERDPDKGHVNRILGIARDITEQKLYEMQLKASEARFRSLVSSIEDGIYTLDREGRHTGIFGHWLERQGMSEADFIGKTQREILGDHIGHIHEDANARAFNGETVTFEWQTQIGEENTIFRTTISPIHDEHDEVTEIVGVSHDITELRALEAERLETERLRLELDKERELLDLKHRFISMVSHEFRTPLSVILSTSNMLERYYDRMDKARSMEYVQRLIPQVNHMNTLLDEVLMLSKASAGMLEFRPEPFKIQAFCEKLIEDQRLVDDDLHRIRLDVGNLPTYYRGDRALVQHILANLMSNARKYSPTDALIVLHVYSEDESLVFHVVDQGIGIPKADQQQLFQPFHRAINAVDIKGTGLGLSIVKSCVDAHGGTIDYTTSPTDGTTFTVRLPLQ